MSRSHPHSAVKRRPRGPRRTSLRGASTTAKTSGRAPGMTVVVDVAAPDHDRHTSAMPITTSDRVDRSATAEVGPNSPSLQPGPMIGQQFGTVVLLFWLVVALAGSFTLPTSLGLSEPIELRALAIPAGLMATAMLALTKIGRQYNVVRLSQIQIPFALWCVWVATSAFWAQPGARWQQFSVDLLFLFLVVSLTWLTASCVSLRSLDVLWPFFITAATLYLAAALVSGPEITGRYSAFGTGPNIFVRVMALGVLGVLFEATAKRRDWLLPLAPAFLVGAGLSGSRGGTAALALVLAVAAFPIARRMSGRGRLLVTAMIAVGVVGAATVLAQRASQFSQLLGRFTGQGAAAGADADSYRGVIFSTAFRIFADRPFTGAGLDAYWALSGNRLGLQHAHNIVLAVASDSGIVGLMLLVAVLAQLLRLSLRRPDVRSLFAALGGSVILISSLFSGTYYDTRLAFILLGIGAILGLRRRLEQQAASTGAGEPPPSPPSPSTRPRPRQRRPRPT